MIGINGSRRTNCSFIADFYVLCRTQSSTREGFSTATPPPSRLRRVPRGVEQGERSERNLGCELSAGEGERPEREEGDEHGVGGSEGVVEGAEAGAAAEGGELPGAVLADPRGDASLPPAAAGRSAAGAACTNRFSAL